MSARPGAGGPGRRSAGWFVRLRRASASLAFAVLSLAIHAAVRTYFGRVGVRHRDRVPRRGPLLLVSNHPAMWTDVLLLDVAAGRKLHFLAEERLFRPAARNAILRVHGALPLIGAPEGAGERSQNEITFRRCRELFRRGEAVAVFPEGVSLADRTVLQLKTGAARLALAAAETADARSIPRLVPAGIHYANRTSYGSGVTVSFGPPIRLAAHEATGGGFSESEVHELTKRIHEALSSLILDIPDSDQAAAVETLDGLAVLMEHRGTDALERARRIARCVDHIRVTMPERYAALKRHARAYRRVRRVLQVGDSVLAAGHHVPGAHDRHAARAMAVIICAPFAALGAVLHAAPWTIGELIAHHFGADDPTRLTFWRIASGLVLIPVEYALALVWLIRGPAAWPLAQALVALGACALLGWLALRYAQVARALRERLRLSVVERGHRRLVRRARREQRRLLWLLLELRCSDRQRAARPTRVEAYSVPADR